MKILVFWAILFGASFIIPENDLTPLLFGTYFGVLWATWVFNKN